MERMGPGTWDRIKTLVTERGKNVRQGGDEIDTDYVRSKIQKVVSLAVDSHVLCLSPYEEATRDSRETIMMIKLIIIRVFAI